MGRSERGDHKAQGEHGEERLHRGIAVEAGEHTRERNAEHGADRTDGDARPKGGRAVGLTETRALDECGAERDVGEDDHEARQHECHGREPIVVRRKHPREDHGDDEPGGLQEDLRGPFPGEPAHHRGAQVVRVRAQPSPPSRVAARSCRPSHQPRICATPAMSGIRTYMIGTRSEIVAQTRGDAVLAQPPAVEPERAA